MAFNLMIMVTILLMDVYVEEEELALTTLSEMLPIKCIVNWAYRRKEVTLAPLSVPQDPNSISILGTEELFALLLSDEGEEDEENENIDELNTSAISTTSIDCFRCTSGF